MNRLDDVGVEPDTAAARLECHLPGQSLSGVARHAFERDEKAAGRNQAEPFRALAQLVQFAVHLVDGGVEAALDAADSATKLLRQGKQAIRIS